MPQQPISPSFLITSSGKSFFAFEFFDEWPNFRLHELPDGVANQFLVVFERKIHRVRRLTMLTQRPPLGG